MADDAEVVGGRQTYEVFYRTPDELAVAYSEHMLQGHIFVPTDRPPALGATIDIHVHLPTGTWVKTMALVLKAPAYGPHLGALAELFDEDELVERVTESLSDSHERGLDDEASAIATILVVDDDLLQREALAHALTQDGHTVICAANGADALGKAIQSKPELIITDVHMPTMDGWQLLRMLRARPDFRAVGVIFLTALKSDEERLRGYRMGVDDYLPKPVPDEELRLRVQRILRDRGHAQRPDALRGDLGTVALSSLLSLVELERRTGYLSLKRGREDAVLHLASGKVSDVVLSGERDDLPALDRLFYLLDWAQGTFELTDADRVPPSSEAIKISYALLEHARRSDETGGRSV